MLHEVERNERMNNLSIGTYVKTGENYIRKITDIITNYEEFDVYKVDKKFRESEDYELTDILYPDDVVKSSDKLIELLEIGDVAIIDYYTHQKKTVVEEITSQKVLDLIKGWVKDGSIKLNGIATKKQFEDIIYKVKDE